MTELVLSDGSVTLIDDCLVEYLSRWQWQNDGRYAVRQNVINGRHYKIYLHAVICQTPKGLDTDHINGDKLDNRFINLRVATRGFNNFNKSKHTGEYSSKYKGVIWSKQKMKWHATIKTAGKVKHLGFFDIEEDAAIAYDAALKLKIDNVRLNFN